MTAEYATIVADPPWRVNTGPLSGMGRGFETRTNHRSRPVAYPTLTVEELCALPVSDLAAPASHLYLWTINKYLEDAYRVARAWGFTPSTMIVWAKTPIGGGMGGAWGISTEYVLFARRGTLPALSHVTGTWFNWPRPYENGKPKHSAKPDAFLDLVEQVSPGPRLELFARRQRLGWDTWGNEALPHVEIAVA